jgi:hypothetical protein
VFTNIKLTLKQTLNFKKNFPLKKKKKKKKKKAQEFELKRYFYKRVCDGC